MSSYKCSNCDADLNRHIQSVHEEKKPNLMFLFSIGILNEEKKLFKFSDCNKLFTYKEHLNEVFNKFIYERSHPNMKIVLQLSIKYEN